MKYSVVVPLKNEAENLDQLLLEIETTMNALEGNWELICIDDGSTDNTLPLLQKYGKEKPYLRVYSFDKNYGQTSAFDAGFRRAKGEWVITLDGDCQNDPGDIPKLIEASLGFDLVCGFRKKRKDSYVKRIVSKSANWIRNVFLADGIKDTGCSLKLYRRECLHQVKLFHGMHRFLPALFLVEGYKVCQIPVNHRERKRGTTKYSIWNRSFNTGFDLLAVRWMKKRHLRYKIRGEKGDGSE